MPVSEPFTSAAGKRLLGGKVQNIIEDQITTIVSHSIPLGGTEDCIHLFLQLPHAKDGQQDPREHFLQGQGVSEGAQHPNKRSGK